MDISSDQHLCQNALTGDIFDPTLTPVEPWPYDQPTRFDTVLERLSALRLCIATMSGDCGSASNPHIWVMATDRNNKPRTVCAKCGASG